MSQDRASATPMELTRRSFEAAESGDYDLMVSFYGPDSVFDMSAWGLGIHTGLPAIRSFFEAWIGAFDEFEMRIEEVHDLGNGVTFTVALQNARPARSRTHLQLRHGAIAAWADGVAVRVTNYRDIAQAREIAERLDTSRA